MASFLRQLRSPRHVLEVDSVPEVVSVVQETGNIHIQGRDSDNLDNPEVKKNKQSKQNKTKKQ